MRIKTYEELVRKYTNPWHRGIAMNIGRGCYVETNKDAGNIRGGDVFDVIKDKQGIVTSVCVNACDANGDKFQDVIPIEQITLYEPWNAENQFDVYDYMTTEEIDKPITQKGVKLT